MAGSAADLFDRFHLAIYRYLLRMTGRPDVAEDLTQDVFVRILRGADANSRRTPIATESRRFTRNENGLTPADSQRAWVFTIARNLLVDWQRRAGRNPVRTGEPEPAGLLQMAAASLPGHDGAFDVREALRRLPDDDREAFLLRVVGGLGHEEIAMLTGTTAASVRSRIFRARAALRAALDPATGHRTAAQDEAGREPPVRRMRVVP